jgi:hypothetical protein
MENIIAILMVVDVIFTVGIKLFLSEIIEKSFEVE